MDGRTAACSPSIHPSGFSSRFRRSRLIHLLGRGSIGVRTHCCWDIRPEAAVWRIWPTIGISAATLAVSLKAQLGAWMDGQERASIQMCAAGEVGRSESAVAQEDGPSWPLYVSAAGARPQKRSKSASRLGGSDILRHRATPARIRVFGRSPKATYTRMNRMSGVRKTLAFVQLCGHRFAIAFAARNRGFWHYSFRTRRLPVRVQRRHRRDSKFLSDCPP